MRTAIALVAIVVATHAARALVLCAKPHKDGRFSTTVKVRERCKRTETALDPDALGLRGPKGDQGVPGVCGCSTTTTTTTSTTTTLPPECAVNPDGGPRALTLTVGPGGGDLDQGFSGRSHNFITVPGATLTYCLTGCNATTLAQPSALASSWILQILSEVAVSYG